MGHRGFPLTRCDQNLGIISVLKVIRKRGTCAYRYGLELFSSKDFLWSYPVDLLAQV